jgi:hypothetical protein
VQPADHVDSTAWGPSYISLKDGEEHPLPGQEKEFEQLQKERQEWAKRAAMPGGIAAWRKREERQRLRRLVLVVFLALAFVVFALVLLRR